MTPKYSVSASSVTMLMRKAEPTVTDVLLLVFNFAACIPVWMCVGMFSVYHLYLASGNSTTIEAWEKDKVATLVRRGKISEIKYPYVSPLQVGKAYSSRMLVSSTTSVRFWVPIRSYGSGLSRCEGTVCRSRSIRQQAVSLQQSGLVLWRGIPSRDLCPVEAIRMRTRASPVAESRVDTVASRDRGN